MSIVRRGSPFQHQTHFEFKQSAKNIYYRFDESLMRFFSFSALLFCGQYAAVFAALPCADFSIQKTCFLIVSMKLSMSVGIECSHFH